jgi:hypothetical protein
LTALLSGSSGIDAILAEEPFALQMLGQQPDAIELITIVDDADVPNDDFLITVSVGLRKTDTDLLAGIETALTALNEATRLQWMAAASQQARNL